MTDKAQNPPFLLVLHRSDGAGSQQRGNAKIGRDQKGICTRCLGWSINVGFDAPRRASGFSPYREGAGYLTGRHAGYRILRVNHRATIIWHTVHMPDEYRRTPLRPDPERIDLAAIKTDLEFAIEQISRLRTQLARTALGIIFSTAVVTTLFNWWLIAH
jgi:hypothetical protein